MTTTKTPREHDTELAAIAHEIEKADRAVSSNASTIKSLAGARYYYRGRQRVTDMTLARAIEIVEEAVARIAAWKADHSYTDGDYVGTDWIGYTGIVRPYEADHAAQIIPERNELLAKLAELQLDFERHERDYTGWSRFFLVTSSPGHVHSSMHCSTCRPTTAFGWLPELSGKTEADAVDELGPTLCSVCFPTAPVAWTTGKKITAAQAAKRAA